ncbi:MAG: DNA topoisomerase VI subunit B [Planctomycetota bacterium]|nr:DNA topoisomerase VI subunit B [Planctomycetota bacterium]
MPARKKKKAKKRAKKAKARKKAARRKGPARKAPTPKKKKTKKKAAQRKAPARRRAVKRVSAQEMARSQREISVAEFFAKNRHLLGYDNPSKALLTAVREAVDNALDACEEGGILPDISVAIEHVKAGTGTKGGAEEAPAKGRKKRSGPSGTADRYRMVVEDNGPGIVKAQVTKIFGKLLYGSKFHRLRMSRGQQGIGISAAALYGQLTTGKPIRVTTRAKRRRPALRLDIVIDTQKNNPKVLRERETKEFTHPTGTRIELELEGRYAKGPRGVFEYLHQTALANPHAQITFSSPEKGAEPHVFARAVDELPEQPREIQPHPYGVELGTLIKMLGATGARRVTSFLQSEFTRVSSKVAGAMVEEADINGAKQPRRVTRDEAERLYTAMNSVRVMAPPTDCLAPIGDEALDEGMRKEVDAEFYTSVTRSPSVYRGNPFQIEVALAFGGPLPADSPARLYRFANRVPLLYQQGACAMTKAASSISWRSYDLQQPRGSLPVGPLAILVHIASVWVPFTSESKEAVAAYDEIHKEIRLALQECGRRLGLFVRKRKRLAEAARKTDYITTYLPPIAEALKDLLALSDGQAQRVAKVLGTTLRKSRSA